MGDENVHLKSVSSVLLTPKKENKGGLDHYFGGHINEAFDDEEPLKDNSLYLINGSKKVNGISPDEDKDKELDDCKLKEQQIKSVSFLSLFRYSSSLDRLLIFIAIIVDMISAAGVPAIILLFGNILNNFVDFYRIQHNMTTISVGNNTNFTQELFLHNVAEMCMYFWVIGILVFSCSYIYVSFFSMTAANQVFKIRCLFMKSVLKQDIGWFDTNQTGDFASRLTEDLSKIQDGIGEKVGICINILTCSIISTCIAFYYGWELTLVCLCVMPASTIAMFIIAKVQASLSVEVLDAFGTASAVAEEVLSSIRTVVSFNGHKKEIERYNKCLLPAQRKSVKRDLLTSISSAVFWICNYMGYAVGYWYGAKLMYKNRNEENPEYKTSTLIVVFLCVKLGVGAIGQIAPYFEAFAIACGATGKVFSVIERKPYIDSSSKEGKMPLSFSGNITLKNVHFKYPARPDIPILRGLNLKVKSGETIALVGPSGCGKSTIVHLIQRFYDPETGLILIDDHNVKDLNVGWLRDHIGIVGQEPILFSTTIAENIGYGKPNATLEEIENAAKHANVHDFINALPLKYETLVGERGTQISGGQKQRIAIARALIKNPRILLLDEATSALDTESEAMVQVALNKASQGRTTIVIAHRLSTIRSADKIVVISDGKVKEIGTHEELMEKKGVYYQLVNAQDQSDCGTDAKNSTVDNVSDDLLHFRRHSSIRSSHSYRSKDSIDVKKAFTFSTTNGKNVTIKETPDKDKEKVELSKTKLYKMCSNEWAYILVGTIAAITMGTYNPIYAVIYGNVLRILAGEIEEVENRVLIYCLAFAALAICAGISAFLQNFMFSIAGEKLSGRLRSMVFETVIKQDISWFDEPSNSVGSLCSRLSSDASSVQSATGSRVSVAFQALSTLIAAIVVGLWYNYKIGLVVVSFIPIVLIGTYFESRMIHGQMLDDKTGLESASKVAIEVIENIRTVASLHQEESFYIKFRNALYEPHRKSRKVSQVRGLIFGFSHSILSFVYSTSMYYGSLLVAEGSLAYPDLFKVIESAILGTYMIGQTIAFTPDYQKAKLAAANIFKLLDMKPPNINVFSKEGLFLNSVKGFLHFKNVVFNYPSRPRVKVLRGLNFEVQPGQTVALVGSSGCGKSTCIQLIERFYDTLQGEVMLDDVCIKDMNVSNLRSHLGLVSQEPVLFSYSLAENIAYGDNSRTVGMDEIIEAARQANIHNFITSLPLGYDTPVGDKGVQMSGGQKQRIAIARALLRHPKVLLLDEATSALDAESERVVQEALDKARCGRTCLIIAHRLTTIQNADAILVIYKGKVVEKGTHQELMNRKGFYFNLHSMQTGIR